MNPVRIAILAVAAVAAIGLAVLLRNLATPHTVGPAPVAQAAKPSVRVLVASHDLALGQRISEGDMTWQSWPADSLNDSFITDGSQPAGPAATQVGALVKASTTTAKDLASGGGPAMQALRGAVVRDVIVKGEPIVKGKVVMAGDGGYMSVRLGPGMRAIAVPVSAETGAGGFIQPGDRIDLIESRPDTAKGGPGFLTQTVVSNARVLAVDQTTTQAKNGQSMIGATVTLEVPATVTPMVAEARARGGVMLALRSFTDTGGGPGLGGDTAAGGAGVRLIKGGEVSEAMVPQ
jgi:pilus assembly protein CpaB